jgi:gag-polyprotein putative aspartyl protease
MSKSIASFTVKSQGGLLRILKTAAAIYPSGFKTPTAKINAIWDTGASGCAITTNVVTQLRLVPTGMASVHTANGVAIQNTYTIDIELPNTVLIQGIIASEVAALSSGCDALIGMDVITLGDFSITNHKGTTCMSFRTPSSHEIDYVKNLTYGITPIKNIPIGKKGSNFTKPKKRRKKK